MEENIIRDLLIQLSVWLFLLGATIYVIGLVSLPLKEAPKQSIAMVLLGIIILVVSIIGIEHIYKNMFLFKELHESVATIQYL